MSARQQVFAIAEPSRRKVVEMLAARGRMSASQICGEFDVSPQDISRHLRVLRESELVLVEKRAQQRIYRVNPGTMMKLEGWAHQMAERLDALNEVVEMERSRVAMSSKTSFSVDREKLEVTTSRVFDAPTALVWKVFTDPSLSLSGGTGFLKTTVDMK